ncbi:RagB/SusD family nutrient uptake outer membrane protein [Saccharicrinis sp. 156]|uniref:RagB/SusD family nutrient uptake outer membrane protein n=1 Tax=Saccharicrinis sp. 156 TaxID=3417574 RepID=UPI003D327519
MRLLKYIFLTIISMATLVSCDDFLDTVTDSSIPTETALQDRDIFLGFFYKAYQDLPERVNFSYEAATDNAIVNKDSYNESKAARGGITTQSNPLDDDIWETNYKNINTINWFLEKMVLDETKAVPTPVRFDLNEDVNLKKFYLTLGEAYFLRAWYQMDLLEKYGGVAEDGVAYGFPITTSYLEYSDDLNLPRNTYAECVQQISNDCDKAFEYLPLQYSESTGSLDVGLLTDAGRGSGIAALALKARAYLYQASPAFNVSNSNELWNKAATAAAEAIEAIGDDDLMSLSAYYSKNNLNNGTDFTNPDLFFRGPIVEDDNTLERENFAPRMNGGQGKFNPAQNLVDAFPMSDGYPKGTSPTVTFDEDAQFAGRDARLEKAVVHHGESFGGITLSTLTGGLDAFGSDQNATRSGYYLQKLLDSSVSLEANNQVKTTRAVYLLGRPELYLNFAEAAVQATGDPDDAQFGYSARTILAKVRDRALGQGNDQYLPTVTTKEAFIDVVRNERRVELCFEDFRFWDLRRWSAGVEDKSLIETPAYGIYSESPVETRSFASPYMPIPYTEIIKTSGTLINNKGW